MKTRLLTAIVTAGTLAVMVSACGGSGAADTAAAPAAQADASGIPRTPDGHPDFTGAFDVNGVEDIRTTLAPGSEIVHTAEGEARWAKVDQALDPNARCLPWGPTRMMCCTRHPIGFVYHKDVIVVLTESQQTFRLVYMDGRPVPEDLYDDEGNVDPQVGGWFGFSTGRWEGDTLVVETVGADERTWVDGHAGHQHTAKMKFTERFDMKDKDTIEYIATIDDPIIYQKPWSFVKTFKRLPPGDRILSHSCLENEKDLPYMKVGALVGGGQP
jgi:hypothetical protein